MAGVRKINVSRRAGERPALFERKDMTDENKCRYCGGEMLEVSDGVRECADCAYEEVVARISDQEIDAESTEDKCK